MGSIKVIRIEKKLKQNYQLCGVTIKYARVMPLDFRLTNVFFVIQLRGLKKKWGKEYSIA